MKPSGIAAILVVGALLLGIGVISRSWITVDGRGEGGFSLGLHSGESCFRGQCRSEWLLPEIDKVRRGEQLVMIVSGTVAALTGLASAILAGIAALLLFQNGRPRGLALTAIILVAIALANGFGFVGAADPPSEAGFGFALFAFMFGGVAVLVGAILTRSGARPPAPAVAMPMGYPPGYGQPPMGYGGPPPMGQPMGQPMGYGQVAYPPQPQVQPGPQCPRCRNISTWVPQYQRGFCNACNSYV